MRGSKLHSLDNILWMKNKPRIVCVDLRPQDAIQREEFTPSHSAGTRFQDRALSKEYLTRQQVATLSFRKERVRKSREDVRSGI